MRKIYPYGNDVSFNQTFNDEKMIGKSFSFVFIDRMGSPRLGRLRVTKIIKPSLVEGVETTLGKCQVPLCNFCEWYKPSSYEKRL